jgi:2-C-methyl-D-erythritol 4-phosphate cytidylyltransferase/2-C-methyl-D-erythritol 2,4-cyclodiphosphate synthase
MSKLTAAIVAAAGAGHRFGANYPKALIKLVNKTLVEHAVDALLPIADLIIVTAPAGFENNFQEILLDKAKVITGGVLRSDSVRIALEQIPAKYENVLVHDAARAIATTDLAKRVVIELEKAAAVIPVLEVVDTIKEIDSAGFVHSTLDRSKLKTVQTPQGFKSELLRKAHSTNQDATDDAGLVEKLGEKVKTITGEARALKITNPQDLQTALRLLYPTESITLQVGIGTDTHAFSKDSNRKLWLAGLLWENEIGVDGHSDGDVAVHAICDALLSAANLGDLGSNFGVDDPKYAGASGERLLKECYIKLGSAGFKVENVSVQIIANKPKIAGRRGEAIETIAKHLGGAQISVSATSTDGLGFTGEGKGISAIATALISKVKA